MPDKWVGEQLIRFGDDLSHHVRYAVMKNPVVLIQLHLVEERRRLLLANRHELKKEISIISIQKFNQNNLEGRKALTYLPWRSD